MGFHQRDLDAVRSCATSLRSEESQAASRLTIFKSASLALPASQPRTSHLDQGYSHAYGLESWSHAVVGSTHEANTVHRASQLASQPAATVNLRSAATRGNEAMQPTAWKNVAARYNLHVRVLVTLHTCLSCISSASGVSPSVSRKHSKPRLTKLRRGKEACSTASRAVFVRQTASSSKSFFWSAIKKKKADLRNPSSKRCIHRSRCPPPRSEQSRQPSESTKRSTTAHGRRIRVFPRYNPHQLSLHARHTSKQAREIGIARKQWVQVRAMSEKKREQMNKAGDCE